MGPGQGMKERRDQKGQMEGEDMKTFFEEGDYDGWVAAVTKRMEANNVSEDVISEQTSEAVWKKHLEAHDLMESGDMEAAREIINEIRPTDAPNFQMNQGVLGGKHSQRGPF